MTPAPPRARAALLASAALLAGALLPAPAPAQPAPGSAQAPKTRFKPADFAAHVAALRAKLPWEGFTIVVQEPFVVIGDEPPARVRSRAKGTVKWASDRLKALYFKEDPLAIVDVWLFKDKASYLRGNRALFDLTPSTPFGYYSPDDQALVMNIATGGGTLVHEMVHPFVAANFPGCPSWFNEGLASLYEQCRDVDGRITGLTNWRLPILQKALREERLPKLATLAESGRGFYTRDEGTNYAHARYLCYYLQERGLLVAFYERFRATRALDPSGQRALRDVLGVQDLERFQAETWTPYVRALRFR
jgi:hypothetical protein